MTNDPTDRVARALRAIAEDGPLPDEDAALDRIRSLAAEGRRRRLLFGGAGVLAAAAAVLVAFVVVGWGDDDAERDEVAAGPGAEAPPAIERIADVPANPVVTVSLDGRQLVLVDGDTGEKLGPIAAVGQGHRIEDPSVATDGTVRVTVAALDDDGEVQERRAGATTLHGGRPIDELPSDSGIVAGAVGRVHGAQVVDDGDGTFLQIGNAREFTLRDLRWEGDEPGRIADVAFSPDGTRLLFSAGAEAYVLDPEADSLDDARLVGELSSPVWVDDSMVLGVQGGTAVAIDARSPASGPLIGVTAVPDGVRSLAVGADGTIFFVDGGDRLYRAGEPPTELGPASDVAAPAAPVVPRVPERPLVVLTPETNELVLHDGATGQRIRTLVTVDSPHHIEDVHLSSDGRVLYTDVGDDGSTIGAVLLDGTVSAADPGIDDTPAWSPTEHGGVVAYVGGGGVRFVDERGDVARDLRWSDGGDPSLGDLDVSPDGSQLLFSSRGDAYVVDTEAASLDAAVALADLESPVWWRDGRVAGFVEGEPFMADPSTGVFEPLGPIPLDVRSIDLGDAVYVVEEDGDVWRDDVELGIRAAEIAVPPPVPASTETPPDHGVPGRLLVAAGMQGLLELDPGTGEVVRTLARAGDGRPEEIAEGYRISDVSVAGDEVVFTEQAGPEDHPSIWRLDPTTGARQLVVDDADHGTLSPDGARLAYVPAPPDGLRHDVPQIVIRDLATGDERGILGYSEPFPAVICDLEWSPDGTRLLYVDCYENSYVGILDADTAQSLADAAHIAADDTGGPAAWLDDDSVVAHVTCCYAEPDAVPPRIVVSDAATGQERRQLDEGTGLPDLRDLAALPDGRLLGVTVDFELVVIGPDGSVTELAEGALAVDT